MPLDALVPARHQEVGVDEDRDHARGPVRLDEAHAAHVAGEVVDVADAANCVLARLERAEVGYTVLDAVDHLIPLVERLDVDRAEFVKPSSRR